jgi:hypothetical protein
LFCMNAKKCIQQHTFFIKSDASSKKNTHKRRKVRERKINLRLGGHLSDTQTDMPHSFSV